MLMPNGSPSWRAAVVADHDPKTVPIPEYLGACYDAGLSWVHFPEGLGGLGVSRGLQAVADRILQGAGGPVPLGLNPMGYGMAAPTIREHAQSEDVKRQWLRPLATTEDLWCQLFSRAGRRVRSGRAGHLARCLDGDEWVINGQKVWTSLAHRARWGLLLARTNPDVPKHKGLTYFVIDMHGAGRGDPAAAPADRAGRVQRGLLHRRPHPRRAPAR